MKLTESMLRDFVTTQLTAEEVADLLTMTGFELEEITVVDGEKVLDINIMANRGDGASILGLAREVLAKCPQCAPTGLYERLADGLTRSDENRPEASTFVKLSIESPDCTRYACRVFEGVTNGSSPEWVQDRLRKIGQRPISLLVDLTNYVMLETGQPLHAFDLDTIKGPEIRVRSARSGETLTTLDGTSHKLQEGQLMVCDSERPVAVAGVMGGLDTEVSASTTRCLLESAHFDSQSVRRTRKQLGLQTDASYRFERHVDPNEVVRALNRFAQLLEEAVGITTVPGVVDLFPSPPTRQTITLRPSRCSALLGLDVAPEDIVRYLSDLGNRVETSGPKIEVTPPSWRIDLLREEDLIEEVGRVHGYELIPELLPIGSTPVGGTRGTEALVDRIREELLRCGVDQAVSHSLRDAHPLDGPGERVSVRNPHSPEMALLRNSNLPCLSDAALKNGGKDIHMFEIGHVFRAGSEDVYLGVLSTGQLDQHFWQPGQSLNADFFSMKGVIDRVLRSLRIEPDYEKPQTLDPRLHPTRQCTVSGLGVIGQIHPDTAEDIGLPLETTLAELNLSLLESVAQSDARFRPVLRHPAARRDIAIVVPKTVPYRDIEEAISMACGAVLEKQWLFDVYVGTNIEPGHHSLAIALQFRKSGNFTDEEANQVRDLAVSALEGLGAKLR